MTGEPLTQADLDRIHKGEPTPEPPCSGCGCEPEWDATNGVYHWWHSESCPVAARIRELVE